MKPFHKRFKHLISLALICVLAVALIALGAPVITGVATVALWQLSQFALSKHGGYAYTTILTPEQIKEFETAVNRCSKFFDENDSLFKGVKDLSAVEGGFAAIKNLPAALKAEQKRFDDLQADLKKLQKQYLALKGQSPRLNGDKVNDECARHLGALALAVGVKRGQITGKSADMAESLVKEILGVELKTALSSSDIPLPTEYSGQVVELVGMYGLARQVGTVFPLGTGTVKLPKLTTDTTFTILAQSVAITEKSPQAAFVTFTPEKFGGMIRIPTELEEDSIIPIGQFIARYAARNIARAEDYNFFASSGAGTTVNGSVEGLTVSTITNSKVTQMASTKTHYSDATLAYLRQLRTVPDASALRNGAYYFHPSFEQLLSSFNTAGDRPYNPMVQLSTGGQPFKNGPTLDGFPIIWVDVMPVYSTGANVSKVFALFGDASFQYLGIRGGVRFDTSMEAGFTTDEILIRALERFTIGLMATGAMAGLETAAS